MLARALQWMREQAAFLIILVLVLAGFLYLVVVGRWGRGTGGVAVAVLVAGLLRGALPTNRVGMLAVRSRVVDTVFYLVLGGVILGVDLRLHG